MRKLIAATILITLTVLWHTTPAHAQVSTSSISGIVSDAGGLAMPNVQVVATNLDTGAARSTVTDSTGAYLLQFLAIGKYKVEADFTGFKKWAQTGIALEVSRQARVDIRMDPGSVNETVTVTGDAALINTTDAQLGRTVQNAEIINLPLVNRDVYSLLKLTPGVEFSDGGTNSFGYPEQRTMINGGVDGGTGSVNYYLDGGPNLAGLRNTGGVMPNPDAVQEFRVITNGYSAEYGRFAGGVVDVVTKSGSNTVHGSAFEFLRNDQLNANIWNPPSRPPLRRNQFGGTLGGPIQHGKTFAFGSYSGLRQRSQDVRNTAIVPTAAQRSSDFSAVKTVITDPFSSNKTPFAGNIIPVSRFDPAAVAILNKWIPAANLPNNTLSTFEAHPVDANEGIVKLDHTLTDQHQLSGSYYISKGLDVTPFLGGGNSNIPWSRETLGYTQQNLNASDTWTISPARVNQFRLGYTRLYGNRVDSPATSLGDLGSKFQIQGTPSLPQITVTGFFQLGNAIAGNPAGGNTYTARDVFSWTRGRHSIRLGGEMSLNKLIQATTLNNYGTFTFSGTRSGYGLADFLLGTPSSMNQDAPVRKTDSGWYYGFFFQDDFKITRRLVFNLGLRYDLSPPFTDPQDRKMTFVAGAKSTVVPGAPVGLLFPGDPGVPRGIAYTDKNNFSPRLGLAWDPFGHGRTSIRASAGIFYGSLSANELNSVADRLPFSARQTFSNPKSLSDPYGNLPGGVSPYPYVYDKNNVRLILPAAIQPISQNFVLPATYQLNFSVQQQVAKDIDVTASYVGALARHLPFTNDLNYPIYNPATPAASADSRRPIMPGVYSSINLLQSTQNANYHGLQLSANKRFARNFLLRGFYTFSKSLEGAQLQNNTTVGGVEDANNVGLERGRTDFDRRHNFVMSGIWKLDYLQGSSPILRAVVNGWSLAGILSLRSGAPFSVLTGADTNVDGVTNDRANVVGNPVLDHNRSRNDVSNAWFNTAAFGRPDPGRDGNAARNLLDGPGLRNVDLSLFRDFKLWERMLFQVRGEVTNAFNFVNLSNPNASLNSPAFGTIRSASATRQAQLGLRLLW